MTPEERAALLAAVAAERNAPSWRRAAAMRAAWLGGIDLQAVASAAGMTQRGARRAIDR